MKLFSQKESAFYLFNSREYEHGTVNHTFSFTPGNFHSVAFYNVEEAIEWLAKDTSSIKFIDLIDCKHEQSGIYCIIKSRNQTYAEKYMGYNFASIAGVLCSQSSCNTIDIDQQNWLDYFAKNEGEIFFFKDKYGTMVDFWLNKKRGSFRYSTIEKFIELVEKFVNNCEN